MPPKPKKPVEGPSKKTEQKQKAKVVEDKTFGLKNKKGGKQQRFIKMVNQQVQGSQKKTQAEKERDTQLKAKDAKTRAKEELNLLFKPVEQKVAKGVDPKSVVCAFFKQGMCGKGSKCKFSHDLNVGRKGEKRNIYEDSKENEDNMDDWDEQKLEEVVNTKHGESNKHKQSTSIICKFFLEAVENSKYGWFWQCPNGETCHYRHALPPGFVLKKDSTKHDKKDETSLEEHIEGERAALSSQNLTRVTLETFLKWKDRKRNEKIAKKMATMERKKNDFKSGKVLGISGREMFEFNPDLVEGDDEGADDVVYQREPEEDEEEMEDNGLVKELDLETLASEASAVDGTGTQAKPRVPATGQENGTRDEELKLDEAAAISPNSADEMEATVNGDVVMDTPIDENLFDGDDLDLVEDELDTLDLDD